MGVNFSLQKLWAIESIQNDEEIGGMTYEKNRNCCFGFNLLLLFFLQ